MWFHNVLCMLRVLEIVGNYAFAFRALMEKLRHMILIPCAMNRPDSITDIRHIHVKKPVEKIGGFGK